MLNMVRRNATTVLVLMQTLALAQSKAAVKDSGLRGATKSHRQARAEWQGVDLFDDEYHQFLSELDDDSVGGNNDLDDWENFANLSLEGTDFGDLFGEVLGELGDQTISDDMLSLFTIGENMIHH